MVHAYINPDIELPNPFLFEESGPLAWLMDPVDLIHPAQIPQITIPAVYNTITESNYHKIADMAAEYLARKTNGANCRIATDSQGRRRIIPVGPIDMEETMLGEWREGIEAGRDVGLPQDECDYIKQTICLKEEEKGSDEGRGTV
ncbi:hypothetical protein HDV00_009201 [Rhizophlyctis rosea]|nr:hypothetical protein HDV00_009201 [Rhizophlyctis rosea]